MRNYLIFLLLCSMGLTSACDNRRVPPSTSEGVKLQRADRDTQEKPKGPKPHLAKDATPDETFLELSTSPISALDFGLYRLRMERLSDLEKQLRAKGLLRRMPALDGQDISKAGYVLVGLGHATIDPYGPLIEFSVSEPDNGAAASPSTIDEAEQLGSQIVSFVREVLGGPCADDKGPTTGFCQGSYYFYSWFVPPSIDDFNLPVVGRSRAAYNFYSRVQIRASRTLKGTQTVVIVTCVGPVMRNEVKCGSSGQ